MPVALQAVLVPLFWSMVFPLSKVIMRDFPPLTLAALRYVLGAAFLTVLAVRRGGRTELLGLVRRQWPALFVLGLAAIVSNAAQVVGLRFATAAVGSIIGATSPVYSTVLAAVFLRERIGLAQVTGLFLALAGVSAIALGGPAGSGGTTPLGVILMFVGALAYSVYTVLGKRHDASSLPVLAISTWLGVIPLCLAALLVEPAIPAVAQAGLRSWLALLALAALPTAIAVIWFFSLVARIGAARASLILYLVPVFGLVQSRFLLGEHITWPLIVGALVSVVGVAIAQPRGLSGSGRRPDRTPA